MSPLQIVLGAVLLAASLFLIVVIMLQDKAKRGLSGAIAGGTGSSYNGKNNVPQKGKFYARLTAIVAVVFSVLVIVAYLFSFV